MYGIRLPWCGQFQFSSIQLLSCVWLCDTMDWSTPGFPVYPQLPELAQTHVHQVGDAIQPSWTILSSVVPFSSWLQSFPTSGSFPVSQFFASGGQSIRISASATVLPMNIQDWFPVGLTGLNFLQSKGLSRVFSNTTVQKHQFFDIQLSLWASLVAQRVKHLPAVQETWVLYLGQEGPLKKEMETHSSILAWKIPWMEKPVRLQSMGSQRVRHDWATSLSLFFMVQLSHPHMTTGKTIALTRQSFVGKVMSLLFNMLSRLVRRRQWHPTPVLLPRKSHGQRSLVGCSPWGL